jgi:hypothetical protein
MLTAMARGLTILAAAGLLTACGASVAHSQGSSGPSCGPAAAHTLAASPQARVYVSGGTAYGCARSGRSSNRLGGRGSCIGRPRVDPVTVTGTLTAYASETCGVDTGTTVVIVRRLTDGRHLRSSPATAPVGVESYQTVHSLVLKVDGAVAWIATGRSLGTRHGAVEVWRSDRHGTTRLDSGQAIQARSLRLTGATLNWRHGTQTRHAALD